MDFLLSEEMRGVRFQLEWEKADVLLREWGIRSTLIVFGSARIPSPEQAQALTDAAQTPDEIAYAELRSRQVPFYEAARAFGRIASLRGGALAPRDRWRDNVIATGGGPGVMEAANRGAMETGAPSIGFNITLPTEQQPNPFTTPELTFRFHYFAMRKMHLAARARALVVFPGGFGTLDEMFELLTLMQTGKSAPLPVVLFNRDYWTRIISFEGLAEAGMVAPGDLKLFDFAESAEEVWSLLVARGVAEP
ncbi:LOG family protein [Phenylobacterium sp.]|uniref:LOG family protein n=1 Tax=Phenylobacterium sp. TaxID=1871053 RepID=UPI002734E37F|nr:LOG family protein [Phenylobacterium sp.]MDP3659365.1 LOG family protein [Phenylobacterium sp.]